MENHNGIEFELMYLIKLYRQYIDTSDIKIYAVKLYTVKPQSVKQDKPTPLPSTRSTALPLLFTSLRIPINICSPVKTFSDISASISNLQIGQLTSLLLSSATKRRNSRVMVCF